MSIYDKLRKAAREIFHTDTTSGASAVTPQTETFTFTALPESLADLQSLPEAAMDTPYKTAALTVCALCAYAADREIGKEMLHFLTGPRPLNNVQISFLDDRFRDGQHVPFSYFKGAVPENDYTPDTPYTLTVESGAYSDANAGEGYKKLFIQSGGADIPREIILRMRGDGTWFLWDQFLLVGIRKAKSDDPWA